MIPEPKYELLKRRLAIYDAEEALGEATSAVSMHLYDLAVKLDVVLKMLPEGSKERKLLNEVVLELGE